MTPQVRCYDCAEAYEIDDRKRCTCGEPLWFDTNPIGMGWPDDEWTAGMWRYVDTLPVSDPVGIPPGTTPLVRADRLDEYVGCTLYLKNEAQNPTGSFKDRGTAVGVSYAAQTGHEWVGTVSHGNMALSTSAYAASAGLECAVFVPVDTPPERLELINRHDPHVFRVKGDYGRLYAETLILETDVMFVNSDTPLRVAGQKTVAYEILEQLHPAEPDALVLPVSSGGQASAVWKAVRELECAGLIDDVPRLYFVQAAACDPIAMAYREDKAVVMPVSADETIAISIANSDPPSGTRALEAARDTGGAVISVPDDETRDAMAHLSTKAGTSVEPSSAVSLAGVRHLSSSGHIKADDDVVTILTGSGYKERYGAEINVRSIDLDDLEQELRSVVGR
ncbi:threonine synthase [Natronorubrum sp. FCH18a]|uniref:threonine synthase n=1 Tax=Natronorubrum sp. FCH18a TaxID=3447018 RepID=UPI003F50EB5B